MPSREASSSQQPSSGVAALRDTARAQLSPPVVLQKLLAPIHEEKKLARARCIILIVRMSERNDRYDRVATMYVSRDRRGRTTEPSKRNEMRNEWLYIHVYVYVFERSWELKVYVDLNRVEIYEKNEWDKRDQRLRRAGSSHSTESERERRHFLPENIVA